MEVDRVKFAKIALLEYIAECFESDDYRVEYNDGSLYILGDDDNIYYITVGLYED